MLRLKEESSSGYRSNRNKQYYEADCPGYLDEHNRRIEINRLERERSVCYSYDDEWLEFRPEIFRGLF